jgi:hypothetical protein
MKFNLIALSWVAVMSFYSCSQKGNTDTTSGQDDPIEWVEMDSFHTILAEAFYPYKDSANLEPAKRLAEEMAVEAETWASASLPPKVNNAEMKAQLNKLKADTRALAEMIKGGASDEVIGTSLQALHNSFHSIMEVWNDESWEHQHE